MDSAQGDRQSRHQRDSTLAFGLSAAEAGTIDPSETAITLPDAIHFVPWSGGYSVLGCFGSHLEHPSECDEN
jgi:hypothetical protein